MLSLPNLPESAFPFVALGFGLVGLIALKIWGRVLDHKRQHKVAIVAHEKPQAR
jgi:hypothetical protein